MTNPKKWRNFRKLTPMDDCPIMIKDHEGNLSPGVWKNGFFPFFSFPTGMPKKWTYIMVPVTVFEFENDSRKIYEYNFNEMLFENGEKIKLNELYDFGNPVSKK